MATVIIDYDPSPSKRESTAPELWPNLKGAPSLICKSHSPLLVVLERQRLKENHATCPARPRGSFPQLDHLVIP